MKGLTPVLSVPARGNADSTTTSAIAPGSIDVRENPNQDLSALNRDTSNALNELGRIFDKKKIEEQQELAGVFGEEAFKLAHKLPNDGKGTKILVHAAIGGIMSSITGAGFTSGAAGAGLNEAVIKEIDKIAKHDPGAAQIVSAIVGAAAARAAGGTAGAGAAAAASGTKNNSLLTEIQFVREAIRDDNIVHNLPEGYCNLIGVSGGAYGVSVQGTIMVFNVEGTPVYSSYSLGAGKAPWGASMIMGRGHLEDSDGNIITDPNIIKEQLTGPSIDGAISMGVGKGIAWGFGKYYFVYDFVGTTPGAGLSLGGTLYEGEQKDF